MHLPDLLGAGVESHSYAANFRDVGSIATDVLCAALRVAVLSTRGIQHLQQRRVHSETRVVVDLETLLAQMELSLEEAELQEEWVENQLKVTNNGLVDVETFVMQRSASRRS